MSTVRAIGANELQALEERQRGGSFARWVLIYLLAAALLAAVSLLVGTSSVRTSLEWLRSPAALSDTVLWDIRLPRAVGAWLVGALLGLGGAIAQSLFRNPLAEPYLLGSASGAALGVTVCLMAVDITITGLAWLGAVGVTGAAFIGAAAGITLTLALSRGLQQTANLLLAGVVVAFLLSALTSLLLLRSPDTWRAMQGFLLGTTGFLGWRSAVLLALIFLATAIPAVLLSRGLDALTLGEDTARSLGLPLEALRVVLLALLSLATAAAVSQAGIVGFVGLISPHLVRESVHVNSRKLIIAAPLCGGVVLQAADLASRWMIRPGELPVGIVTACLGGSYLVVLLWRRAQRE
ncbi:MAG: iron ABC transporter permease [Gammaproteobacteria bacterium]|nr:iron ABC transporter permease [Gammaproteobacteria bacterium]MBV8402669.1 iron ABC transporter permease [Gammaproteobacteria bacterium]